MKTNINGRINLNQELIPPRLSKDGGLGKFVIYLTCAVVIGTAPGWSTKKCLSSRRSADQSCIYSCQIIPTLDMSWLELL